MPNSLATERASSGMTRSDLRVALRRAICNSEFFAQFETEFINTTRAHKKKTTKYSPHEWTAVTKVRQIRFVAIHVPQIVLAADQNDGRIGTEAPYLWIPHRSTVAQRHRIRDGEAQQHHIGATVRETPVLLVIAKCVPQP